MTGVVHGDERAANRGWCQLVKEVVTGCEFHFDFLIRMPVTNRAVRRVSSEREVLPSAPGILLVSLSLSLCPSLPVLPYLNHIKHDPPMASPVREYPPQQMNCRINGTEARSLSGRGSPWRRSSCCRRCRCRVTPWWDSGTPRCPVSSPCSSCPAVPADCSSRPPPLGCKYVVVVVVVAARWVSAILE